MDLTFLLCETESQTKSYRLHLKNIPYWEKKKRDYSSTGGSHFWGATMIFSGNREGIFGLQSAYSSHYCMGM